MAKLGQVDQPSTGCPAGSAGGLERSTGPYFSFLHIANTKFPTIS